jgi:hypothetical protein
VQAASAVVSGRVVGRADLEAMLEHDKKQQLLDCDELSCWSQLSQSMGAYWVLAGNVGRVGKTYVVTVSLVDATKSKALARGQATIRGEVDLVFSAVGTLTRRLFGK